jgi:hypothetical protein
MKRKDHERLEREAEAGGQERTPPPGAPGGGQAVSSAPNASFEGWSGEPGFDSPPQTSHYLSNPEVEGSDHATPYYPPGGADDETDVGSGG